MLFIEYDVNQEGEIEVVGLINAVEEDGRDPEGESWMAWRESLEDEGMGCAPVPPVDLAIMEETENPEELRNVVERILLADRAKKEVV